MSNNKKIVREEPGASAQMTSLLVGRPMSPENVKIIDTVVRTPNVWFRIEQRPFVSNASQASLGSRGSSLVKRAARRGHKLKYTTRKRNGVVKLYLRSVVEG